MRIDELTRQRWAGEPAAIGSLADGFHCLPWTAAEDGPLLAQWRALSRTASSPNPFFAPWYLLPALRMLDARGATQLALLISAGRLVGLAPFAHDPDYHGRRLPHASVWIHPNAFCGSPLIEPGFETAFWQAWLAAIDARPGAALFAHAPQLPTDSPAFAALLAACKEDRRPFRIVHCQERAFLRSGQTRDDYLAATFTTKKRKELRRQRKRLEELGAVSLHRRRDERDVADWANTFLALEQSGWKGAAGSALASDPRTARLFHDALAGAAAEGVLERLDLAIDGEPVAMLVNFLAPPGSFAFKTTFDERFARFSPGVLLQLENLALLDDPGIAWCDSCAAADHPMIERIWRDKRAIAWVSMAIGGTVRRAAGAALAAIEARGTEQIS